MRNEFTRVHCAESQFEIWHLKSNNKVVLQTNSQPII